MIKLDLVDALQVHRHRQLLAPLVQPLPGPIAGPRVDDEDVPGQTDLLLDRASKTRSRNSIPCHVGIWTEIDLMGRIAGTAGNQYSDPEGVGQPPPWNSPQIDSPSPRPRNFYAPRGSDSVQRGDTPVSLSGNTP